MGYAVKLQKKGGGKIILIGPVYNFCTTTYTNNNVKHTGTYTFTTNGIAFVTLLRNIYGSNISYTTTASLLESEINDDERCRLLVLDVKTNDTISYTLETGLGQFIGLSVSIVTLLNVSKFTYIASNLTNGGTNNLPAYTYPGQLIFLGNVVENGSNQNITISNTNIGNVRSASVSGGSGQYAKCSVKYTMTYDQTTAISSTCTDPNGNGTRIKQLSFAYILE